MNGKVIIEGDPMDPAVMEIICRIKEVLNLEFLFTETELHPLPELCTNNQHTIATFKLFEHDQTLFSSTDISSERNENVGEALSKKRV